MTIQAPSGANQLALTLEQFVASAEAFLQNHYEIGSDCSADALRAYREDISKILKAIADLQLDVDNEKLEAEFELVQEKKDLMADYFIKF